MQSGEKLKIHAQAWNRMLDSIATKPGSMAAGLEYQSAPYTWVYARNSTGNDVDSWAVMAISGFDISPDSDPVAQHQFERMPVLTTNVASSTTTGWCVSVEPIKNNTIGRVAVAGAVQVQLIELPKAASFQVLWKDSVWALVVLGGTTVRLGTISANWNKGATATVTEKAGDGGNIYGNPTFTATNHFATVSVPAQSTRRVACALIGSTWVLIAAEC